MGELLKILGALCLLAVVGMCSIVGLGTYSVGKSVHDFQAKQEKAVDYKSQLSIQPGWKWERERNYTYVRGRVKNGGAETVRYWAVTVKYFSKTSEMLDQDYTNSGETLAPGDSDTFQIMHKHDPAYKYIEVDVSEVRLK